MITRDTQPHSSQLTVPLRIRDIRSFEHKQSIELTEIAEHEY
jgi:hypothetical protein